MMPGVLFDKNNMYYRVELHASMMGLNGVFNPINRYDKQFIKVVIYTYEQKDDGSRDWVRSDIEDILTCVPVDTNRMNLNTFCRFVLNKLEQVRTKRRSLKKVVTDIASTHIDTVTGGQL